jgi:hypothetical protein
MEGGSPLPPYYSVIGASRSDALQAHHRCAIWTMGHLPQDGHPSFMEGGSPLPPDYSAIVASRSDALQGFWP